MSTLDSKTPAHPMPNPQPVASRSSVSTDAVGVGKDIAVSFFQWWWNQPGNDTLDGFDQWASGPGAVLLAALRSAPPQQEAGPVACFACEDRPKAPNIPCAVCGLHPSPATLADETLRAEVERLTKNLAQMIGARDAARVIGQYWHARAEAAEAKLAALAQPAPVVEDGKAREEREWEEAAAWAHARAFPAPEGQNAEASLRKARPIVEADLVEAKSSGDADWEGQSYEALEAIDAALSPEIAT